MSLEENLEKWWNGKSKRNLEDYIRFHGNIISKNIPEEDIDQFFNALNQNKFDISKTNRLIPIKNIFNGSKIDEFVTNGYIGSSLKVTVKQPSNGAGEFLLASNYNNIKFGSTCDLLIDNKRVEVKGVNAKLGDFPSKFKQMDKSLEYTIRKHFKENWEIKNLNSDILKLILIKVFENVDNFEHIKFLGYALQNTKGDNDYIAKMFAYLFTHYVKSKNDVEEFKKCICSIHLYNYCRTKNCAYMLFVNNSDMMLVNSPTNPEKCYSLANKLKIGSWENGRGGLTISLD